MRFIPFVSLLVATAHVAVSAPIYSIARRDQDGVGAVIPSWNNVVRRDYNEEEDIHARQLANLLMRELLSDGRHFRRTDQTGKKRPCIDTSERDPKRQRHESPTESDISPVGVTIAPRNLTSHTTLRDTPKALQHRSPRKTMRDTIALRKAIRNTIAPRILPRNPTSQAKLKALLVQHVAQILLTYTNTKSPKPHCPMTSQIRDTSEGRRQFTWGMQSGWVRTCSTPTGARIIFGHESAYFSVWCVED
ncbi:hypothetical protein K439DRAFT_940551 [Ramaria rubella]|nr:hypothetical protein K439DRAFT_940551 [Ramaria rubella]